MRTTLSECRKHSDTADLVAEGTGIDVIYHPARNWRILVNFVTNENVQSKNVLEEARLDI